MSVFKNKISTLSLENFTVFEKARFEFQLIANHEEKKVSGIRDSEKNNSPGSCQQQTADRKVSGGVQKLYFCTPGQP
jgi:hypothetical protein